MKTKKIDIAQVNAAKTRVQGEAVRAILRTFKSLNRATCVMCCGSGKTRVAEWVIRKLKPTTVVVCVPNLQLVKQFIDQMKALKVDVLPVCSRLDGITPEDLGIESATTSVDAIQQFLRSSKNAKLIVSTYHSFQRVAKAAKTAAPKKRKLTLDLLICDEAHRTAGKVAKTFSACLHDSECKFERRLFLTATPRVYSGDKEELHSMDDQSVYGPVAYELPYRKGVELGIVNDFQTYVLELPQDVHASVLSEIDNLRADSMTLAEHVAAHHTNGPKNRERVFAFHNRLKDSRQFCEDLHRCGVHAEFVTGADSVTERKRKIESVMSHKGGSVLCSVRALAEGVDVPGITRILIADPKSSLEEINQIVGRGFRLTEKTTNPLKICVPMFLGPNEELGGSEFTALRKVLVALRNVDSDFSTRLQAWSNNARDSSNESSAETSSESDLIRLIRADGTEVTGKFIASRLYNFERLFVSKEEEVQRILENLRTFFEAKGRRPTTQQRDGFHADHRWLTNNGYEGGIVTLMDDHKIGTPFFIKRLSLDHEVSKIACNLRAFYDENGKRPSVSVKDGFSRDHKWLKDHWHVDGIMKVMDDHGIGEPLWVRRGRLEDVIPHVVAKLRAFYKANGRRPKTSKEDGFQVYNQCLRNKRHNGIVKLMDDYGIGEPLFQRRDSLELEKTKIVSRLRDFHKATGRRPSVVKRDGFSKDHDWLIGMGVKCGIIDLMDEYGIGKPLRVKRALHGIGGAP